MDPQPAKPAVGPSLSNGNTVGAGIGRRGPPRLDAAGPQHAHQRLGGYPTSVTRKSAQADRATWRDAGRARGPEQPPVGPRGGTRAGRAGAGTCAHHRAARRTRSQSHGARSRARRAIGPWAPSGPKGAGRHPKTSSAPTLRKPRCGRFAVSDSPPPSPSRSFPCQRDPERWFDRRSRADALAQCLTCAARPWCAQEALKWRASWGLWAGVWIDGRHNDAVAFLQAIAADDPGLVDQRPPVANMTTCHHDPAASAPLRRPSTSLPARSAPAAVLARSFGHCEVFAESCRYTFERLVSRCRSEPGIEKPSPAELFAACAVCAEIVAGLESQLATRSGYAVDAGRDPALVPFYWRGSRWVLLDRDGWLTEMREDAQTA
jgi:hypothetical protein